ncbi:hypothetical protein C3B61_09780 [Cryobacterium zongtaii]|uniref:Uncharacterized protein n=1 Tax=Cryobacterium zongtaii TaxID=1259217 RepID=A0A2S3ZG16_9MICO|nr:hypothetical protein C3B61_09780 [Cryobacterium zongtaii]
MPEHSGNDQDAAKLPSLEKAQRIVQSLTGALSMVLLFTMTFPIPMAVNCVVLVGLVWASLVLDRRIRERGGKGGIYV